MKHFKNMTYHYHMVPPGLIGVNVGFPLREQLYTKY